MPSGKLIPVEPGEYPQLEGLQPGAQVRFSGMATVEEGGLMIESIDLEAEGMADRELKSMSQSGVGANEPAKALSDEF